MTFEELLKAIEGTVVNLKKLPNKTEPEQELLTNLENLLNEYNRGVSHGNNND